VCIYSSGYFLRQTSEHRFNSADNHKAGIIQPNSPTEQVWSHELKIQKLAELFTHSLVLKQQGAEFVVWPEFSIPIYPLQNKFYGRQLEDFSRQHLPLFTGFTDLRSHQEVYNSVILFKSGEFEKYDKVHLTPFGEYVLFRKLLFFVRRIVDEIGDFSFGKSIHNIHLHGHAIATPICYEIIFPELVRNFIDRGGELIITISNDSWFGNTSAPPQHLAMATFRAVENRRYILRSTTNGISAVITPAGKIEYQSPYNRKDSFIAKFVYLNNRTIFTRIGYLFPYLCALLTLLMTIIVLGKGKIRRR
jgi:apolipoprotein N-acyltransferase